MSDNGAPVEPAGGFLAQHVPIQQVPTTVTVMRAHDGNVLLGIHIPSGQIIVALDPEPARKIARDIIKHSTNLDVVQELPRGIKPPD